MEQEKLKKEKSSAYLPLARRWRSKTFDQIVGQDLAVKILKNSLFRQSIFPVYLFAGQRGCGKTSMARIFAAGLECEHLAEFKQNSSLVVPCAECAACHAVRAGMHPDVIEIDAASHTGVEHVRQLIETTSFLPVQGGWKVYVIDEAHMLSKAAFNALLKILEEPPRHVLFILATTDPQKIIETVRSRSLQIFFEPLSRELLSNHLKHICDQEGFAYNTHALDLIAQASEGSARDALVTLERVVLCEGSITLEFVQKLFGYVDQLVGERLWQALLASDASALDKEMHEIDRLRKQPDMVWKQLVGAGHELYQSNIERRSGIVAALDVLFVYEPLFAKTMHKLVLLRVVLDHMATCIQGSGVSMARTSMQASVPVQKQPSVQPQAAPSPVDIQHAAGAAQPKQSQVAVPSDEAVSAYPDWWMRFVMYMGTQGDVSLCAFFKHVHTVVYDEPKSCVTLGFAKHDALCKEFVEAAIEGWRVHLCREMGVVLDQVVVRCVLIDGVMPKQVVVEQSHREKVSISVQAPAHKTQEYTQKKAVYGQSARASTGYKSREAPKPLHSIKIDAQVCPTAALVAEIFEGTIVQSCCAQHCGEPQCALVQKSSEVQAQEQAGILQNIQDINAQGEYVPAEEDL